MARMLAKLHDVEEFRDARAALLAAQLLELQQRILDVLLGRKHREQIERLEDEADGPRAELGQLRPGCGRRCRGRR